MPEELREQVPLIKEMLTAMGVNVVTKEGYEADDILGNSGQEKAKRQEWMRQSFLVTEICFSLRQIRL